MRLFCSLWIIAGDEVDCKALELATGFYACITIIFFWLWLLH
jgi:hypothetical protein